MYGTCVADELERDMTRVVYQHDPVLKPPEDVCEDFDSDRYVNVTIEEAQFEAAEPAEKLASTN